MIEGLYSKVSLSKLQWRIVSGVILAPLAVAAIIAGGYWFLVLAGLVSLLALYEFTNLVRQGADSEIHTAFGLFYLVLCVSAFVFLRFAFDQGAWLTLAVILSVWASDIGAYMAGKSIGGPKMAPLLSPNKTWAGLGGAMVSCGLALVILQYAGEYFEGALNTDLNLRTKHAPFVFGAGMILGVVGQAGDLLISYYKRRVGAKDTGTLIPGHGGILDRIDALLLVTPAFLIFIMLWL